VLQRATALHVERLVDRLVREPHRLIIGETEADPVGDLLGAPRLRPPPVLAPPVTAVDPPHGRPWNAGPVRALHGASSFAVLGRLAPVSMPLCRRGSILQGAAAVAVLRRSSREIVDGDTPGINQALCKSNPCPASDERPIPGSWTRCPQGGGQHCCSLSRIMSTSAENWAHG